MNRLRWVMEGGEFWELDVSTPITMDGVARPLPNDGPLPLGLSRGTRLSRPKQIDFFQKFMAALVVPSFSAGNGFSIQRALTIPSGNDWFTTLLGQFNLQQFVSSVRKAKLEERSESSWLQTIGRHLSEKSLYAYGVCSEFLVTPEDKLHFSYEARGDRKTARKKAVFNHKFPHLDLTMEGVWPGLYIDKYGEYWEVPVTLAADLASVTSDSGASYHLCLQHISGLAKPVEGNESTEVPANLLPGLYLKSAFSFKKNIDFWRSEAKKLKYVQPYDFFLSGPHISGAGLIGVVATALVGDNSQRSPLDDQPKDYKRFDLYASMGRSAVLADLFASLAFSAQYGNFQKKAFDLTQIHGRLNFPSGSKFFSAATCLAQNLYKSERPSLEAVQAACPNATLSLQQQIVGPFSLRVDSELSVNLKNEGWKVNLDNPVIAIEYALYLLGSAKAVAWYAPKQKEFMVELRLFEI
ncbi:protein TRIGALACTOSYLDIACYLGLYCEROL 4, chloroplastic-like [Chenopodium quinoa]|uniref:protein TRIGALACTOSYLDIACYLGLYCEROL 4, chloroplastic-like n=1 Tax=Chenopodium quinoa TaxID=63459 RepID=UPI000B7934D3|nr:protein TRIGALACTOSYLDIACYLGLYCEROL 4, chloroplastic-like [Chenopodium quinoa]